jgi:hypothetical protein
MIGRLLASAVFVVALGSTAPISKAVAQMTAPPPASSAPAGTSGELNSGPGKNSPGVLNGGHTLNNANGRPTTLSPSAGQANARQSATGPQANGRTGSTMSGDRQTAQGHEQENGIAEKLNACEAKPMTERQACFDAATRM